MVNPYTYFHTFGVYAVGLLSNLDKLLQNRGADDTVLAKKYVEVVAKKKFHILTIRTE